ncbi:ComEC/Rec2 family competence protein [Kumtagia ephedrae]|uniref:Competence protein n=1 Tax=Kumtagia ephedrae TaxID=2116701 RepID=A0A2P7SC86_9HYPH|nr:ComEC/Rec2 family competence protein [Mesorhizobium ephedrae]PSJ60099.1 competence protein [Mesorhizobium ephedrae]
MADTSAGDWDERLLLRGASQPPQEVAAVAPFPRLPVNSRRTGRPFLIIAGKARTALPIAFHAAESAATLEVERGTLFLLVPVFLAVGALLYFQISFEPDGRLLLAATATMIAAMTFGPRAAAWRLPVLAVLLVCLGALLGKVETWRAGTAMLGGEVATRVNGYVTGLDRLANGRVRLTIDVASTERPRLRYAPQRIRATARKLPEGVAVGSTVSGLVRLRPPSGPVRPGSYDFSFESYFDGIGASGFFMSGPELASSRTASLAGRFTAALENVRNRFAERVRQRVAGAEGEIAAALMVGVRAGIPDETSEALRRTGLYHVISISGLHMALVAGVVIGALRAGMALFPGFASRRPVKKYAAAGGLAAVAGYLAISGGEVAAQRSFLMLAVMLVAVLCDRAALTMRNLAISAIIVLVLTPHEVVGPSFQMSFAATAALVAAYAWWSERRNAEAGTMPAQPSFAAMALRRTVGIAVGLFVTSLVAGLATTAYGAYHFQRIAPLSLGANLVAMPIVSVVVMPAAVLAAAAMPFGLDGPFLDLMGKGISAMVAVAEWFSRRSPVDAVGLISVGSVLLLTLALVIATVATTWLRLAALPFALAGLLTLDNVRPPDVLVSEDGALVGLLDAQDGLAVNRTRANAFTAQNWQRALEGRAVHKPQRIVERPGPTADKRETGGNRPRQGDPIDDVPPAAARNEKTAGSEADGPTLESIALAARDGGGFLCGPAGCAARLMSGAVVVHTADAEEARRACAFAAVIVLDDAAVPLKCADERLAVVTRRDLARSGSAAVFLTPGAGPPQIDFAIGLPERPWHGHRVFSREARGLPPYRRGKQGKPQDPLAPAGTDVPARAATDSRAATADSDGVDRVPIVPDSSPKPSSGADAGETSGRP